MVVEALCLFLSRRPLTSIIHPTPRTHTHTTSKRIYYFSAFQPRTIDKLIALRKWIQEQNMNNLLQVMVDGGINDQTCRVVRGAGADVLVAGTYLFEHSKSMKDGVKELLML